jgi:hypothetical protein
MNIRSILYAVAKGLGDAAAIKNKTIPQRIARRVAGRITGKALGALFRGMKK